MEATKDLISVPAHCCFHTVSPWGRLICEAVEGFDLVLSLIYLPTPSRAIKHLVQYEHEHSPIYIHRVCPHQGTGKTSSFRKGCLLAAKKKYSYSYSEHTISNSYWKQIYDLWFADILQIIEQLVYHSYSDVRDMIKDETFSTLTQWFHDMTTYSS